MGGIVARQGVFEGAHGEADEAKIRLRVGAGAIDPQGGAQQLGGGIVPAALVVEHGEEMQRVEMGRVAPQNVGIEPFGLVELAALVGAAGAPERGRQARSRLRHPLAHWQSARARAPTRRFLTIGRQAW